MVLLTCLDSTLHALDLDSGRVLKSFKGHNNTNYRSQAAFGPGEATVVMGDEDGKVWAWDTETVSCTPGGRIARPAGVGGYDSPEWQSS